MSVQYCVYNATQRKYAFYVRNATNGVKISTGYGSNRYDYPTGMVIESSARGKCFVDKESTAAKWAKDMNRLKKNGHINTRGTWKVRKVVLAPEFKD